MRTIGPEKRFENKIKEFISQQNGWYVKFFANKMTKVGVPDILACINGYFIGIEVKSDSGEPSKLQIRQCQLIREAGGFSFIVYPSGFEKLKKIIMGLRHDDFDRTTEIILK